MNETTRQLTSAIASGDTEAFARFYQRWFDEMLREARRAGAADEQSGLDVVHDAMMRVIRKLRPMPDDAHLRRWLRKVVRSCAVDRIRRESRRRRRELRRGSATATIPDPVVDGHEAWLESELERLDEGSRQLLVMRHRFGWTLERIGAATGMPVGTVHGRITRAVDELRRRAKEQTDG